MVRECRNSAVTNQGADNPFEQSARDVSKEVKNVRQTPENIYQNDGQQRDVAPMK
jgi:hypothetical protein